MFQGFEGEFPGLSPGLNPYRVLGVMPGATIEAIRERFFQKIKAIHPDRHHHLSEAKRIELTKKVAELTESYKWFKSRAERRGLEERLFATLQGFFQKDSVAGIIAENLAQKPAPLEPQRGADIVSITLPSGGTPDAVVWQFVAGEGSLGKNGAPRGDKWFISAEKQGG